jgi:hypothetical protein
VGSVASGLLAVLHLGFEQVRRQPTHGFACGLLGSAERGEIVGVVVLDELERPSAVDHVAPDHHVVHGVCHLVVAGGAQGLDGALQVEVSTPGQSVERVQMPPRVFGDLKGGRKLSQRVNGCVVYAVRAWVNRPAAGPAGCAELTA